MNSNELLRWRKWDSFTIAHSTELARVIFYTAPLTWTIRFYDKHWASKSGRQAEIHELTRRAKGDWSADVPVPLPRVRKRTLTGPLPSIESLPSLSQTIRRSRQRTESQESCAFLTKLPFEIRQDIYELVLLGRTNSRIVHILKKHGNLGHWRCRLQGDGTRICDASGKRCLEGWLTYKARLWSMDRAGRLDIITDGGVVALLQTCRTIYTEAIKIIYARNTFHFYDPGVIRHFSTTILPQRLNSITSLMIDWERKFSILNTGNAPASGTEEWRDWKKVWCIISRMEGLLVLTVVLKPHEYTVPQNRRKKMCQPMMEIKGLRRFELIIPANDSTDWDFAKDAPFRIIRA